MLLQCIYLHANSFVLIHFNKPFLITLWLTYFMHTCTLYTYTRRPAIYIYIYTTLNWYKKDTFIFFLNKFTFLISLLAIPSRISLIINETHFKWLWIALMVFARTGNLIQSEHYQGLTSFRAKAQLWKQNSARFHSSLAKSLSFRLRGTDLSRPKGPPPRTRHKTVLGREPEWSCFARWIKKIKRRKKEVGWL